MNKSKKERKNSFLLGKLNALSEFLYSKLPSSMSGSLFSGKIKTNKNGLFSALKEKIRFKERISLPLKRAIAKGFDGSYVLNKLSQLLNKLPSLQIKCVGIALFSFGLYTAADFLIKRNVLGRASLNIELLFTAVLTACAGAILSGSSKTCSSAVSESVILKTLIERILGIKLKALPDTATGFGRGNVAFIIGIGAGFLGSLISPYAVLASIPVILFVYAVLSVPECGVVSLFLLLPFLNAAQASALSSLNLISYILKLIRGKRTFKLRAVDITVLAVSVLLFFGGIFSVTPKESTDLAISLMTLISAYFVIINTITTAEWIKRCVYALISSFIIALTFGITGGVINNFAPTLLREIILSSKTTLFKFNPILIHLSVAVIPFLSILAYSGRSKDRKVICSFIIIAALTSLAISSISSAFVSALLGLVVLLLICSKRSITFITLITVTLPMTIMLLPSKLSTVITNAFTVNSASASQRNAVLTTVDKMLSDCFAGGIGIGEDAFRRIYPLYSHSSFTSLSYSSGLYTQLMVALGITGLLVFIIFIALFVRRFFSYYINSQKDDLTLKQTSVSAFSGVTALLIMGFVSNIWHDPTVSLLFWLITALTVASIRVAENSRQTVISDGPFIEIDCNDLKYNNTLSGGKR